MWLIIYDVHHGTGTLARFDKQEYFMPEYRLATTDILSFDV